VKSVERKYQTAEYHLESCELPRPCEKTEQVWNSINTHTHIHSHDLDDLCWRVLQHNSSKSLTKAINGTCHSAHSNQWNWVHTDTHTHTKVKTYYPTVSLHSFGRYNNTGSPRLMTNAVSFKQHFLYRPCNWHLFQVLMHKVGFTLAFDKCKFWLASPLHQQQQASTYQSEQWLCSWRWRLGAGQHMREENCSVSADGIHQETPAHIIIDHTYNKLWLSLLRSDHYYTPVQSQICFNHSCDFVQSVNIYVK